MQDSVDYSFVDVCPVKIPATGKKLFTLDGVDLFIRPLGGLLYFYEVSTGRFLLVVDEAKRAEAFVYLLDRRDAIQRMIDAVSMDLQR